MPGRVTTVLARWSRKRPRLRFVAAALVLPVTAAVVWPGLPHAFGQPGVDPETLCRQVLEEMRSSAEGRSLFESAVADCTVVVRDKSAGGQLMAARSLLAGLVSAGAPRPVAMASGAAPGCVRGPGRPVLATTIPTLSATFAAMQNVQETTFELRRLGGTQDIFAVTTSGQDPGQPATVDIERDQFGPGESYQWRVRARGDQAVEDAAWQQAAVAAGDGDIDETRYHSSLPGWSDWCEFTVSADAPDLRSLDPNIDLDNVRELGLRPDRRYAVTLTVREWRTVLEPLEFDVGSVIDADNGSEEVATNPAGNIGTAIRGRIRAVGATAPASRPVSVTLDGGQWASLAWELANWAGIQDEMADEDEEVPDGAAFWALLDRISTRLGGPAHPTLGHER
ncbi:hypothetical protein EV385_3816 [Krasilnikovia cinnamomea]|uniref:Uncharacterized protein n=1 Tax=Krasilnikovia cinnamomea TaxID=349313 RepID=A0A4V2G7B7_9ACTN|nr:hypothetical protein [Krasilnikovia cinnamomea]RZU51976.1 hypothetical protein EV385_3816 [Krasilnikovia cinnamomea]